MLESACVNSYLLYRQHTRAPRSHLDYRRALVEYLATACIQIAPPRRLPGRPWKRQADDPESLDQNRTSCLSDSRGSIGTASSAAQEGESVTAPCTIAKHLLTTLASAQINFSNVTIPTLFTGHNTYLILTPPFSHLVCSMLSCIYLYVIVNEKRIIPRKSTFELKAIIGTEVNFVELQVSIPRGSMIP